MGRNAIGDREEGAQPGQRGLAERLALGPAIGHADDGAQGDGEDIEQLVLLGAVQTRVLQMGEVLVDGGDRGTHGNLLGVATTQSPSSMDIARAQNKPLLTIT